MNILKNRLDNHKRNIFGETNIKFTFKNGIQSVDISSLYFNNFF